MSNEPAVVRLGDLTDVVATVPFLLGFEPSDSLVAVALRGSRERLTFSVRVDLPSPDDERDVAEMLAASLVQERAKAALLFVYTDAPEDGRRLPRRRLVDTVRRTLPMPLRDAVLVTDRRVWSYVCTDVRCCPPEGRLRDPDAPGSLAVAAAYAMQGHAVLPSREAVVRSVEPVTGSAAESMGPALDRAGMARVAVGAEEFGRSSRLLLADLFDRFAAPPARVTDDEVAQVVLALHDVPFRDEVLEWCGREPDVARGLFGHVGRHALPPVDAPACTVLGFVAYVQGEGVAAATALERALQSEPGYSMARLLLTALRGQVPPREIRTIVAPARRGRSARRG